MALELKKIAIKNFKSLVHAELDIAPLTFLLGSNSAGKSSLIQALKLLVTSVQSGGNSSVALNSQLLTLGTFSEVRSRGSEENATVGIELTFSENPSSYQSWLDGTLGATQLKPRTEKFRTMFGQGPLESQLAVREFGVEAGGLSLELTATSESAIYSVAFSSESHSSLREENLNPLVYKPFAHHGFINGVLNSISLRPENLRHDWYEGQYVLGLADGLNVSMETAEGLRLVVEEFFASQPDEIDPAGAITIFEFFEEATRVLPKVELGNFWLEVFSQKLEEFDRSLDEFFASLRVQEVLGVTRVDKRNILRPKDSELDLAIKNFIETNGLPRFGIFFTPGQLDVEYGNSDHDAGDLVSSDFEKLSNTSRFLASKVKFLGPLRIDGFAQYKAGIAPNPALPVGEAGELAAQSILANPRKSFNFSGGYPLPAGAGTNHTEEFQVALNAWIRYLEIGTEIAVHDLGSRGAGLQIDSQNMYQMGTGVSQVLPVIVSALLANPGDVLLLEQPELHLHPAAQQKLADFFIAITRDGHRTLIVETHSEYFVNRLRRAVVLKQFRPALSTIAFFEPSEGGTSIRQVAPSESGGFDDWPKGFFAQTEEDLLDILEALESED